MAVKSTFSFNEAADQKLNELADKLKISKSELLRRAITLYDYLDSAKDDRGLVKIERSGGEKVDLLLP
jgi:predicted transcriptional regulator